MFLSNRFGTPCMDIISLFTKNTLFLLIGFAKSIELSGGRIDPTTTEFKTRGV